jgi:hypothetical protein
VYVATNDSLSDLLAQRSQPSARFRHISAISEAEGVNQ